MVAPEEQPLIERERKSLLRVDVGSVRGSVFNLCSATLGAGALAIPSAFAGAGVLPGIALLCLGAAATVFSIQLLIAAVSVSGARTYEQLSLQVFGRGTEHVVEAGIILFSFGTAIAYLVALGDLLEPLVALLKQHLGWLGWLGRRFAMAAAWGLVMFPLSLFERVNSLRWTSLLGVLSIAYLVLVTICHACAAGRARGWREQLRDTPLGPRDVASVLRAMPVMLFAFTCQVNVPALYAELRRPSRRRFGKVARRAAGICWTIYLLMGIFGAMEFGRGTNGNVLSNYDLRAANAAPVMLAYLAISLTIVMAFPLVVLPCRHTMQTLYWCHAVANAAIAAEGGGPSLPLSGGSAGPQAPARWLLTSRLFTLLISALALAVAMVVPDIKVVFEITGGTASAFVCFVLPSLLALRLGICQDTAAERAAVWALLLGGAAAGALGTGASLYGIATG